MVAKKKTSTRKPTAAQLAALKRGREKLAKQRQADKKKVREALKSTANKIKKRTSKIMTTAKKRATKAATSEIPKTRKKLRKKGLGVPLKKKTMKGIFREKTKEYSYKVSSNKSARTLTIRKYYGGELVAKYRTNPLPKDEFNYYSEFATQNDIQHFLRNSGDYYEVR